MVKRNRQLATLCTFSVVDQCFQGNQSHVQEVIDDGVTLEDGSVTRQVAKLLQCADGSQTAGTYMHVCMFIHNKPSRSNDTTKLTRKVFIRHK